MDYLSEFRKVTRQFNSEHRDYERLYPGGFPHVMDLLGLMIYQLEEDEEDFDRLDSIGLGLFFIVTEYHPSSESSYGKKLLTILAEFIPYVRSRIDQ
jgi:hypothetical protein